MNLEPAYCFQSSTPGSSLNVAVLYENFACAERAMELCRNALDQFGPHFKLNASSWKIDGLEDPEFQCEASADMAKAELAIISWLDGASFSKTFKSWLSGVLKKKVRALLSVIHCSDPKRKIPPFFHELGRQPGIALLSNKYVTPARAE